jgi:hypothetical protein
MILGRLCLDATIAELTHRGGAGRAAALGRARGRPSERGQAGRRARGRRGPEGHAERRSEAVDQVRVPGRETPAAKPGMRDQQATERFPRPTQREHPIEPGRSRRGIQQPAFVVREPCHGSARAQAPCSVSWLVHGRSPELRSTGSALTTSC